VILLRVAKRIFLPIAFVFLAYFAWESRELLVDVVRGAKPLTLAISVLVWMLMHALAPLFSMLIFRARNVPLSYRTAARIHITNLPARYIPGGIWHTVGRIAGFRDMDINQRDISIFVFLENLLAVCVAFVIGGSLLAVSRGFDGWGQIAALSAVGAAVFLLASPFILSLRVIQGAERFPIRNFVAVTIVTAITWCVAATAFVIYLSAFPGLPLQAAPLETAGTYLFSWGVGFISIFAPQGIGVFEVVAADLMRGAGTLMSVAALLAGFRLIILVADVAVWAALRVISSRRVSAVRG
jgi:hypothetical protein